MENITRESVDNYQQQGADVGTLLRKTRESYGKTLADVERILRIRECQLAAIEAGDTAKLPGRVYAIGFVRTYAEYLGLDGGEIVRLFKAQYMDAQNKQTLEFALPASDSKIPSFGFAVALAILLLGGAFYVTGANRLDRAHVTEIPAAPVVETPQEKASVSPAPPPQNAVLDETSAPPSGEKSSANATPAVDKVAAEPAPAQKGIILKMIENSWVEIKDAKGKVIVSDVLKVGDQYFVPDNPGLTMSLGNAGGVEIVMNGRIMKPLGKTGDIRRDIPLDTDYLKTLEFKEEPPKSEKSAETVAPAAAKKADDVKPD